MVFKRNILFLILILIVTIAFTACSPDKTTTVVDQSQTVSNENQNPPEASATYKYIDPSAISSVTGIGDSQAIKWKVITPDKDADKVKKVADLVNLGIDRKEPTKKQLNVFKTGHPLGISIIFNDESNSIVNVYPVYGAYENGKLEKVSKDLYLFENIVGDNKAYFTISSKDMVNYLLKDSSKDFKIH